MINFPENAGNTFAPALVTIPAHKIEFPSNFFKMSYKIILLKKWICDFISYPIFIKFSKDHAYFLTHRKMYNLCSNSWIFTPKNG